MRLESAITKVRGQIKDKAAEYRVAETTADGPRVQVPFADTAKFGTKLDKFDQICQFEHSLCVLPSPPSAASAPLSSLHWPASQSSASRICVPPAVAVSTGKGRACLQIKKTLSALGRSKKSCGT